MRGNAGQMSAQDAAFWHLRTEYVGQLWPTRYVIARFGQDLWEDGCIHLTHVWLALKTMFVPRNI